MHVNITLMHELPNKNPYSYQSVPINQQCCAVIGRVAQLLEALHYLFVVLFSSAAPCEPTHHTTSARTAAK